MRLSHLAATAAFSAVLLAGSVSPAFAVAFEGTPVPAPTVRPIRQKIEEMRTDRIENRAKKLQERCTDLNTRFTTVSGKIQTRITNLQGKGKDVTTATTDLATANTDLSNAESLCTQAVSAFNAIPVAKWSEQQPEVKAARALAKQSRDAFQKTHQDLAQTIKDLVKIATGK